MKELSRAARRRYDSLNDYVKTEVLPALERRGLYERRKRNLLWVFPVTRWELTRSGEAARAQLKHNRKLGEEHFGDWVSRDPERAYSFLGLAGSSLLLMEALHPELRNLQDVDDDDYYGGGITYPPGAPGSSGEIYPDALPDLEGALSAQGSWSDGVWGDSSGSTHGGDSSGGGWFDGGGFDGGGGGGFDGGGGGGGF